MDMANRQFPAVARAGGYPIYRNHCFLRVVYDHLFQKKWQAALDNKKPAIHQLDETQLRRAIHLGNQLMADRQCCEIMNRKSLEWRGKQ
ncbi:hypothetical protein CLV84_2991 [Neolewinella xylanilytica]|uniref:Uncharacterized protein n=2 Tax=Neolewinella xylanilytica TaxID=1514080 RepID=A0A2S6I4J4_9BACT|nr:hypothetical protein CLV84_2991 [Neolewinella xylanilytica]